MWGSIIITIARHGISMSFTLVKQKKLLHTLTPSLLFFLLFLHTAPAMPRHSYNRKESHNNQNFKIHVKCNGKNEEPIVETSKYYNYKPGLYVKSPRVRGTIEWLYAYSKTPVSRKSLDLKVLPEIKSNTIFLDKVKSPNFREKGFHYFAYRLIDLPDKGKSVIAEIRVDHALKATITPEHPLFFDEEPIFFPENASDGSFPFAYKINTQFISYAGTEAFYRVENFDPATAFVHPYPEKGFDENWGFFNPLETTVYFLTPGVKKIHIDYAGQQRTETVTVLPPQRKPTVVLFNANDSDNNHKPDHQDGPFPDGQFIPDHELKHINLLGDAWITETPPWELGNDRFFQNHEGYRFKLSATDGIRLWSNQTRHIPPALEYIIHYDKRDEIRQWLQTAIYIEGLQPSAQDGQETIKLELLDAQGELVSFMTWPVTVLHLYINHDSISPSFLDFNRNSRFNTIINPAVIVTNLSLDSPEENCAWFEVSSSKPQLLDKYEDLIEWRVSGEDGQNRPLLLDQEQSGNEFFARGKKIGVLGLEPTLVSIGIRLTGTTEDYISFQKPALPRRRIPFVLHFFSGQPDQKYLNRIQFVKTNILELATLMNIIGRQAGIFFELQEATPADNLSRYTDELFWEVEQTKYDKNHSFPKQFNLKEATNILPPIPQRGLKTIFDGYKDQELIYQGPISNFNFLKNFAVADTKAAAKAKRPIQEYEKYILRPHLPINSYQRDIFAGTFLHKGIPDWALSTPCAAYCTAVASMENAVNINFVKVLYNQKHTQLSAAIAPHESPHPMVISEMKDKRITMTTYFQYNAIPKLGQKKIAATLFSFDQWAKRFNENARLPKLQAITIVHAILETLGLQPMGLQGDMRFYQNEAAWNQARHENILVQCDDVLIINPISPCTDHSALPENYRVMNIMRNTPTPAPGLKTGLNVLYKINTSQAALLHLHTLPIPE